MIKIIKNIIHPRRKVSFTSRQRNLHVGTMNNTVRTTQSIIHVPKRIAKLIAESPRLGSLEI